jgi:hypothetical protein
VIFTVRCENPECPYEPADEHRTATMPEVGRNLYAMPPIVCRCGFHVLIVNETYPG